MELNASFCLFTFIAIPVTVSHFTEFLNSIGFQENFQESESDEDFVPEEVSEDEDHVISDEESAEEESNSEIRPLIVQPGTFIARDGTEWTSSTPMQARRRASVNIVDQRPGLRRKAREISHPVDAFNCIIDEDIVEMICHETNRYTLHKGEQGKWIDVTPVEIRAFFGLLLLAGDQSLLPQCPGTYLKKLHDKVAPMRIVTDKFGSNCRESYSPNAQLCVDEQLLPFRGRCPFKVYIKSKPHRYGIKYGHCATLSRWTGKRMRCNNGQLFTSLAIGRNLLSQGKTLTGTIRWMRKEVPLCMQPNQTDVLHSSSFLFTKDAIPKRHKLRVILEYNACKGGVDAMDKMVWEYSCCRNTKRWPLLLFMNMLDVAAVNAFVVFVTKFPSFYGNKNYRKRLFLKDLGMRLVRPNIECRTSENFSGMQKNI
ncbi:hypothetical protein T11_1881 [Trichinella zimbabwensis]|uniref:PiggyBac transposable element-derived protein domain-containing protein n=1 Tax=Trichinella zimbabwensis TaxID=268475 RepID=A0A0V1I084_9BILA|nr:hypothetical protein T11_1881 [Trichinella zimbabwensis]